VKSLALLMLWVPLTIHIARFTPPNYVAVGTKGLDCTSHLHGANANDCAAGFSFAAVNVRVAHIII
jgi:hypothetical protein